MSSLFILGLILSAVIGLSLGLIGGGGSILTVPILVYLLGVGPHEAVTMSLAVVGATSLFGSFLHYRKDNLDIRGGAVFGGAGIIGAFLGAPLTKLVSPELLLLLFGLLMLVVAGVMIARRGSADSDIHAYHPVQAVFAGLGVGVLTGFLGVGGGFLIVPALVFFGGLDMRKAVGTSLFVIFLNCVAGLAAHLGGGGFDLGLTAAVMGLAVGGAIIGTMISSKMPAQRLQKVFAILVLGVGVVLVFKNYTSIV